MKKNIFSVGGEKSTLQKANYFKRLMYLGEKGLTCIKDNGLRFTIKYTKRKLIDQAQKQNSDARENEKYMQLNYDAFQCKKNQAIFDSSEQLLNPVDIIVPVYNGADILSSLLKTIPKTKVPYRLILIDDKSTDKQTLPMLRQYQESHKNAVLVENATNLGYTCSVNKALKMTKGHVVLLNTDVRLPNNWLERMIAPIISDSKIASASPFTNNGTICSFPNFCENNELYLDLSVDQIDSAFAQLKPAYTEIPTGVGFCMAINRKAIDAVGLYDEENFPRGYGEENDWCQRAIKAGFKNVMVENLFVFHQHGATFTSKEKQQLIESHSQRLNRCYPHYETEVRRYCQKDPVHKYRDMAKFLLFPNNCKIIIAFSHAWGGGADTYLVRKVKEENEKGHNVIVVQYERNGKYLISRYSGEEVFSIQVDSVHQLFSLLPPKIEQLWVNELVSYPDLFALQKKIISYVECAGARLIFRLHDFYCICPNFILLDECNHFCGVCVPQLCKERCPKMKEMEEWRKSWKLFLVSCDEITAFSNDSKDLLLRAYPELNNIYVVPHKVTNLRAVLAHIPNKRITIGVIGAMHRHKGIEILLDMCKIICQNKLPISIRIIGFPYYAYREVQKYRCISYTGPYKQEDLPKIVEKEKIDIVLIPSIWPETFSYTTEEAMMMGLPVAVFDLGAPAERVKKYDKGIIIEKIDAGLAIERIMDYFEMKKISNNSIC